MGAWNCLPPWQWPQREARFLLLISSSHSHSSFSSFLSSCCEGNLKIIPMGGVRLRPFGVRYGILEARRLEFIRGSARAEGQRMFRYDSEICGWRCYSRRRFHVFLHNVVMRTVKMLLAASISLSYATVLVRPGAIKGSNCDCHFDQGFAFHEPAGGRSIFEFRAEILRSCGDGMLVCFWMVRRCGVDWLKSFSSNGKVDYRNLRLF